MNRFIKSTISFVLMVSMILFPISVTASEKSLDRIKYNFINIEDLGNTEYTYEENGITYKVLEKISPGFSENILKFTY